MSDTVRAILLGWLVLSTSVWIGGYITIGVVARVATSTLDTDQRIAFFRQLGRAYAIVGNIALVVAIGTGAALLAGRSWGPALMVTTVLAAALLVASGLGQLQAVQMTRLRRAAAQQPGDAALGATVRWRARAADVLRALIGLLSLALVALGCLLTL